jgi:hypothetical protein
MTPLHHPPLARGAAKKFFFLAKDEPTRKTKIIQVIQRSFSQAFKLIIF